MLLALDLGNTNLTVGVFRGEALTAEFRIATDRTHTGDQYAAFLLSLLRLHHIEPADISGAILGSVVPGLDAAIAEAVRTVTGKEALLITPALKTDMPILLDHPAQLGADLLAGGVAAIARYGVPCVIWDLGTATTMSVVDRSGAFLGGAIMPGIGTSLDSLVSRTSLLPHIGMEMPAHVIGANTVDSMRIGSVIGTAAMMDGMCDRVEAELGTPARVIVTGGLGRTVAACCRRETVYDGQLLLEGLRLLYEKNTTPSEREE